ncbi:hypothetical protein V6M85_05930 [Sulfolobus tengchongensis]|uniref:Uncharacterized protein n=1 Tax=Sulfolobus tengchongensis TaxID=207809 RepID=A0AAX4L3U0_9CREN
MAEKELLEDEKHEVKILSLVPTKIRNELDITSNDYRDLVNKIRESLKINNDDNTLLEVIPYEDAISFGTSLFFSYLNIYNVIKTFSPNLILLDISYSDSSFSTLISKASEIAMTDLLFTQQVDNYIYAVVSKRDNGYIQPISNIVKDKRNTSLTEYLLREMKIMKS